MTANPLKQPLLSVLMAVHNGEKYLQDAIKSMLNQTFRNFEFLIIDDGSIDGSATILEEYAKHDTRIRLIHQHNRGLTKSLNRGIFEAKGRLIARMDADDIALPDRLAKQIAFLNKNSEIAALGTWVHFIDEHGSALGSSNGATTPGQIKWDLSTRNNIWHPTAIIRREWLEKLRGYDESFPVAQDYDLWARLCQMGGQMAVLPEPLLKYRWNSNQISKKKAETQNQAVLRVLTAYNSWLCGFTPAPAVIECLWNTLGFGSGTDFSRIHSALKAARKARIAVRKNADAPAMRFMRQETFLRLTSKALTIAPINKKASLLCFGNGISAAPQHIFRPRTIKRFLALTRTILKPIHSTKRS